MSSLFPVAVATGYILAFTDRLHSSLLRVSTQVQNCSCTSYVQLHVTMSITRRRKQSISLLNPLTKLASIQQPSYQHALILQLSL